VEANGELVIRSKKDKKPQISNLRNRNESRQHLHSIFAEGSRIGGQTASKKLGTSTGLKDNFQMFFLEKIWNATKVRGGKKAKEEALQRVLATLPEDTNSPVWRITGELT
jgi:hypothetical protein